jgi:thymidylate synthase (FAD)
MESEEKMERASVQAMDAIIGHQFPVYDKGFIQVVDYMGGEDSIVQAARVSYGKGTKKKSDDRGLIRYLLRHSHTTPFEMCELKLHVKVEMDTWRQWIRHRMASVNEYSTRYSEAIDDMHITLPGEWRVQSGTNKQGSSGFLPEVLCLKCNDAGWIEGDDGNPAHGVAGSMVTCPECGGKKKGGRYLSRKEQELHKLAREIYEERLAQGVAREQARKDLPLANYTEAYWKIDLHNLLHFLSLRMDSHAQWEIRSYGNVMGHIVQTWLPNVWEAFNDYNFRRSAILLTRLDAEVIKAWNTWTDSDTRKLLAVEAATKNGWLERRADGTLKDNRERTEFENKAEKLGFIKFW